MIDPDPRLKVCRAQAIKIALGITGNNDDAEDVAQEVLLILWQKYNTLVLQDEALTALCCKITTNKAIDFIRSRDSRNGEGTVAVEVDESSDSVLGDKAVTLDDPEGILGAEQQKAAVMHAIGGLSEDMILAWTMHASDVSYAEMAIRLNTTESNCRQMVHRVTAQLRATFMEG